MKNSGIKRISAENNRYGRSIFSPEDIGAEQLGMFDGRDMALYSSGMFTWEADLIEKTIVRTDLSAALDEAWHIERFLNFVHTEDVEKINTLFLNRKDGHHAIDIDIRMRDHGDYRWYKIKGAIYHIDAQDKAYALGVAYDINKLKEHTQRLEFLEKHDYLTGLKNMETFDELYKQIAQYNMYPQALVLANIDHLKEINDTLGYRAGNTLIKNVAHVIEECFFDADLIARIGGGEYCAVFSGKDETEIVLKLKEAEMMLHKMYLNLIKTEVTFGYAVSKEQQDFSVLYHQSMDRMQKKKVMKHYLAQGSVVDNIGRLISKKAGWGKRVTRLQSLSVRIAQKLGLSEDQTNEVKVLAKIADIGFVGLDDRLIAGRKDISGKDMMRYLQHIETGRALIASIDGLSEMEALYLDIYKRYDEWKDGISMSSRIIAGAAAFDDIVYGAEDVTYEIIFESLSKKRGVTLCPKTVDAIFDVIGKHYAHNETAGGNNA